MQQSRVYFGVCLLVVASCLNSANSLAQERIESNRLEGYNGSVAIRSNAERLETTVALTLSYSPEGKSNQIVFHVQGTCASVPASWTGPARVLTGEGVLAILPLGQSSGLLFKFPELRRAASIEQMKLSEYSACGIARFGETKALTADQIELLVNTDRISDVSSDFDPDKIKSTSDSIRRGLPTPEHCEPGNCVAGGPGSTSCGAGGCTVTCGAGYYACCEGGTCLCAKTQ